MNILNINFLLIVILYLIVFGIGEVLYKRNVAPYITRKVVHIGGSIVAALMPLFINLQGVVVLGIFFFLLLLFSKRYKVLKSVHENDTGSHGAFLFPITIIFVALLFWSYNPVIFQGAILILGFSDGMAGIIGNRYGKHKYNLTGLKTVEGSLTFFLVTLFIFSSLLIHESNFSLNKIQAVLMGTLAVTLVESLFSKGWDNVFIPISSGIVLYFIL